MGFKFEFEFCEPVEDRIRFAKQLLETGNDDEKAVAKAVLDITAEGRKVRDALVDGGNCDLAPYLDIWLADAVDAAERLAGSNDPERRMLAECLIDQEKSIIRSKESVLKEMRDQDLRPGKD